MAVGEISAGPLKVEAASQTGQATGLSYRPPATGTGYELPATGYRLPATSYERWAVWHRGSGLGVCPERNAYVNARLTDAARAMGGIVGGIIEE